MPVVFRPDQRSGLLQRLDDGDVSLPEHALAHEGVAHDRRRSSVDGEPSQVVDGTKELEAVLQPSEVILLTVPGGSVDEARTGLGGDVVPAGDHRRRALVEWVLVGRTDEGGAGEGREDLQVLSLGELKLGLLESVTIRSAAG